MSLPVLLYDGTCGLCSRAVQFVLRRDHRGELRFAPLGGAFARDVIARHPGLQAMDTVVWFWPASSLVPERTLVESAAVLEVLRYLGGPWAVLAVVGRAIPGRLLDALYRVAARSRHRFPNPSCQLPAAGDPDRFID